MTAATGIDLDALFLDDGSHVRRDDGVCLMEAVAWWAGRDHTDAPPCVSVVLRTFGIRLNDALPDERRQGLKSLIPALVGTADDGLDEARSYMALDWLVRTYTPAWLDLAGLGAEAQALRGLRRIVDLVAATDIGPVVRSARSAARSVARSAAPSAAWSAAWSAAAGYAAADATTAAWAAWSADRKSVV